jgi:hypothetical protein
MTTRRAAARGGSNEREILGLAGAVMAARPVMA